MARCVKKRRAPWVSSVHSAFGRGEKDSPMSGRQLELRELVVGAAGFEPGISCAKRKGRNVKGLGMSSFSLGLVSFLPVGGTTPRQDCALPNGGFFPARTPPRHRFWLLWRAGLTACLLGLIRADGVRRCSPRSRKIGIRMALGAHTDFIILPVDEGAGHSPATAR